MGTTRGAGGSTTLVEVAAMAPGPGLAAALAAIDRSAVGADAMLDVIAARARLLWHVQGELLADLARAVCATLASEPMRPDVVRSDEEEDRIADAVGELVGWTLHWTTRYAQGQVAVAVALHRRLPMVLAAVQDGQIDQAKAEAFVDALGCVNDEVASRIATRLLPKARTWTLTELRASLRYHVDKADPNAARRRYRRRVAERDVSLQAQPDGTATLHAQGLAPHRAAAAFDRIDRIARAARASGDVRTLAQLRADALCDVLAGVPFQLSPTTDPLTAQADASAEGRPDRAWPLPRWRTESRFTNGKTSNDDHDRRSERDGGGGSTGGPQGGGDPGDDRAGGPGPKGGWPSEPMPPEEEPVGIIDLYDYDRACITDEDWAWADIGYEPPGAAEDETPDWWYSCHPARPAPDHPDSHPTTVHPSPMGGQPMPMGRLPASMGGQVWSAARPTPTGAPPIATGERPTSAAGSESRCEMAGSDSRFENRIPGPDPEDLVWAAAQADALFDRAVLSRDVLAGDRCVCGGRLTVRPGVVDVQVKLTTLAGLDEDAALIPGLGVTLAPLARRIAFDPHTRPVWRWSIFDSEGDLLHHGLTRHRPSEPQPLLPSGAESGFPTGKPEPGLPAGQGLLSDTGTPGPQLPTGAELLSETRKPEPDPPSGPAVRLCSCRRVEPGRRRGTVELQLTLATLRELLTHPHRAPGWQAVLADIAAQVDRDRQLHPPGKWRQTDQHGNLYHHGHTQRMPDAVEEAFIRARDRSCRAPHCHVTASRCELDHRIEYAKGGPSHRGNVDLRCKRHHHMRDRHDVRITRTGPTVTWTIPSGRTFTVTTDKDLILTREDGPGAGILSHED